MNEKTGTEKKNYGGWAFIPLVVFLVIYLGGGMFFSASKTCSIADRGYHSICNEQKDETG